MTSYKQGTLLSKIRKCIKSFCSNKKISSSGTEMLTTNVPTQFRLSDRMVRNWFSPISKNRNLTKKRKYFWYFYKWEILSNRKLIYNNQEQIVRGLISLPFLLAQSWKLTWTVYPISRNRVFVIYPIIP